MIRTIFAASALSVAAFGAASAQEAHGAHGAHDDHAHAGETLSPNLHSDVTAAVAEGGSLVLAEVNGMVCDFCATAMTRTFGRRDEVAAVHVDLDTKELQLVVKAGESLDDATIRDLVTRSGYETVAIRRPSEA